MTKEVIVSVTGIQFEINKDEPVEMITVGNFYNKNGKDFVLYNSVEDENEITKNIMKFSDKKLEITKKGGSNVHMVFEEGNSNETYYETPVGSILIGITTDTVNVERQEDYINILIKYALEVNYSHVSDCDISIKIKSKSVE